MTGLPLVFSETDAMIEAHVTLGADMVLLSLSAELRSGLTLVLLLDVLGSALQVGTNMSLQLLKTWKGTLDCAGLDPGIEELLDNGFPNFRVNIGQLSDLKSYRLNLFRTEFGEELSRDLGGQAHEENGGLLSWP